MKRSLPETTKAEASAALTRRAAIISTAAAFTLSGCNAPHQYRKFRLTLRLTDGVNEYSGSSIRETWYTKDPPLVPSDGAKNPKTRGEATAVNLGNGRFIFGLSDRYSTSEDGVRHRTSDAWDPFDIIEENGLKARLTDDEIKQKLELFSSGTPIAIGTDDLPVLVVFGNINNKYSARVIQPEDVPLIYPNVNWSRCTAQVTDDSLNSGNIEAALPWIGESYTILAGKPVTASPDLVTSADFQWNK